MSSYFLNMWSLPYFVSFLFSFFVFWLLLYRKAKDEQVRLYIIAIFFTSLVGFTAGMATCSLDPEVWAAWTGSIFIVSALAVCFVFHFSYVYLVKQRIFENKKIFVIYLIPFFLISLLLMSFKLSNPEVVQSESGVFGIYDWAEGNALSPLVMALYGFMGLMLTLTSVNFIRMFRQSSDQELRRRASYFVLSFLIPLIGLIIVFMTTIFSVHPKLELSIASLSISRGIIAYGILKDRLFDIDFFVTKSFSYTLTTFFLAWAFLLSEESLNHLISESFFGGIQVSRLISAIFVVILFFPLKDGAHRITTRLFPHTVRSISVPKLRAMEIYKKQLECALEDGVMSKAEIRMLKKLRLTLEISDEDHEKLSREMTSKQDNH